MSESEPDSEADGIASSKRRRISHGILVIWRYYGRFDIHAYVIIDFKIMHVGEYVRIYDLKEIE